MPHVRNAKFSTIVLVVIATCMAALLTNVAPSRVLAASSAVDRASYVDPFTGTGVQQNAPYGGGDTFPGADVPFGMVQWSPDTQNYAPGGYWYPDTHIRGFSLTHLNGAGCSAYSDIPFMPYVGAVTASPASSPATYISSFSHSNESAVAGYYQVKLDSGVHVELTATQRSGAGRFTYPTGKTATMLVNVSGSINGVNDAQANIGRI
jgi:putative alpha-1,2-mannosidase